MAFTCIECAMNNTTCTKRILEHVLYAWWERIHMAPVYNILLCYSKPNLLSSVWALKECIRKPLTNSSNSRLIMPVYCQIMSDPIYLLLFPFRSQDCTSIVLQNKNLAASSTNGSHKISICTQCKIINVRKSFSGVKHTQQKNLYGVC